MSASVYRAFDADENLLYIGHSTRVLGRLAEHAATKGWWRRVTHVTVEHFESRLDASTAEAAAIASERPEMNERAGALIAKDRTLGLDARREIGRRIRAARRAADITQVDLAARLHISQSAIAQWERGKNTPAGIHRARLSEMLGLTFEELA